MKVYNLRWVGIFEFKASQRSIVRLCLQRKAGRLENEQNLQYSLGKH